MQHANPPPPHLVLLYLFLLCLCSLPLLFAFFPSVLTLTHPLSALIPLLLFSLPLCPSSPRSLLILFISADLTKDKVTEEFPFYVFAHPKVYLRAQLSESRHSLLGVYSTGCLLVYSLIKGLPDSLNQIILYKQKDLLQLVIDFLLSSLFRALL